MTTCACSLNSSSRGAPAAAGKFWKYWHSGRISWTVGLQRGTGPGDGRKDGREQEACSGRRRSHLCRPARPRGRQLRSQADRCRKAPGPRRDHDAHEGARRPPCDAARRHHGASLGCLPRRCRDGRRAGSRRGEGQRRHRRRRDAAVARLHHERRRKGGPVAPGRGRESQPGAQHRRDASDVVCAHGGARLGEGARQPRRRCPRARKERRSDGADVGRRRQTSRHRRSPARAQGRSAGADEGHVPNSSTRDSGTSPRRRRSRKASSTTRNAAASRRCCSRRSRGSSRAPNYCLRWAPT